MKQIYGIDLSKEKFDVCFLENNSMKNKIVKNKLNSITKFLESLPNESIIVAEHTGTYGNLLVFLCNSLNMSIALVPGYEIKHSLGMLKGKSDKLDAQRIREYGIRFSDKLKFVKYEDEELSELKEILRLRNQLVKERKMLITYNSETDKKPYNSIIANHIIQKTLEEFDKSINSLEDQIFSIISSTESLKSNFHLITSIKSIGKITACELIIKTENFKKISTAKKAASYAAICPFPNSSGKMITKKRINNMGDKTLKTLLFLCSLNAIRYNKEYKLYYERKKMEGKPFYLIMNNVSNKLLRTIYSIIKTQNKYDTEFICLDPREREKLKKVA